MSQRFETVNPRTLNRTEFIATFGAIYEHSPWIAERLFEQGVTEEDREIDLFASRIARVFLDASKEEQLAVIRAHPDLAGKAARAGSLTAESSAEQASAGIDSLSDDEYEAFTLLNEHYKKRFDFPFIMAVKGSNKNEILNGFRERIHNSVEQEFERALAEINKIALFRLSEL